MSEGKKFMPKNPVKLDPPKNIPITAQELSYCDGEQTEKIYIAIKGTIFDVTNNTKAYGIGKGYHVLTGRDASRALGKSSLKPEDLDYDISWDYSVLSLKQLKVLDDWYTFFSNRYNVVGYVCDLPQLPEITALKEQQQQK